MKYIKDGRLKGEQIEDLDEIKVIEVNILEKIVHVCEENKLKYILAYGTLLGAIRHKGFIPWDDDVDIIMPRYDYNKLLRIWKDERYCLVECTKNREYVYPFAKVYDSETILEENNVELSYPLGVYVDIFPCDAVNGTWKEKRRYLHSCERIEKMRVYSMKDYEYILNKNPRKNFGRKIIWKILRFIGPAFFSRILTKKIQKYDFNEAHYVGCICNRNLEREIFPKEIFDKLIDVEFEGKKYKAPQNYHLMLTVNYGDYMTLPPIEDRIVTHGFRVWKCKGC